jgi:hypothetical protein
VGIKEILGVMNMTSVCYQPNGPNVLHEVIDGEAVLINLENGNYYSIDKVGAEIWSFMETGASAGQIIDILSSKYEGSRDEIETAVNALLVELLSQALIIEVDCQSPPGEPLEIQTGSSRLPFEAPVLHSYTDMSELLLLDPIHDVDETGWPKPAPEGDA